MFKNPTAGTNDLKYLLDLALHGKKISLLLDGGGRNSARKEEDVPKWLVALRVA